MNLFIINLNNLSKTNFNFEKFETSILSSPEKSSKFSFLIFLKISLLLMISFINKFLFFILSNPILIFCIIKHVK